MRLPAFGRQHVHAFYFGILSLEQSERAAADVTLVLFGRQEGDIPAIKLWIFSKWLLAAG